MTEELATSEPDERAGIWTFYSYKGGTGRSMAAANVACLLGSRGNARNHRVLLIDWDLEAPGLHRYLPAGDSPGVLEYFEKLMQQLDGDASLATALEQTPPPKGMPDRPVVGFERLDQAVPLANYVIRDVAPGVDFMRAGPDTSADYASRVATLDWRGLHRKFGASVFRAFRDLLTDRYEYVLIDSRTGVTDAAGICTMILPDVLALVFTTNQQSLDGAVALVGEATEYRRRSGEARPLDIYPVPSRVVTQADQDLKDLWRQKYQAAFTRALHEAFQLERPPDLTKYFDELMLPHVNHYSYGERLAVQTQRNEANSLHRAYVTLSERLLSGCAAWELAPAGKERTVAPLERGVDARLEAQYEAARLVTASANAWAAELKLGTSTAAWRNQLLLRGESLSRALQWAENADYLYPNEASFLAASARRQLRLQSLLAAAVALLLATSGVVGLLWVRDRQQSQEDVLVLTAQAETAKRGLEDSVLEMQRQLESAKAGRQKLESDVATTAMAAKAADDQAARAQQELHSAKAGHAQFKAKYDEAYVKAEGAQNELKEAQLRVFAASLRVDAIAADVETAKEEAKRESAKANDAHRAKEIAEAALASERARRATVEASVRDLERVLTQMRQELDTCKQQRDKLHKVNEALQASGASKTSAVQQNQNDKPQ